MDSAAYYTLFRTQHIIKWKLNMKINMKHAIKIIAAYACVFRHHGCLLRPLYEFRNEPKTEYCLCECILNHIERCLSSSHSHFIVVHETSR